MKIKHPHSNFKPTPLGNRVNRDQWRDDLQVRRLARRCGMPLLHTGIYLDWIRRGEA